MCGGPEGQNTTKLKKNTEFNRFLGGNIVFSEMFVKMKRDLQS